MARIAVIKLGALGDVIMATALIQSISEHHAGDELTLLTTPAFAPLFASWPGLKLVTQQRRGFVAMYSMWRLLRCGNFDCVYDLQSNDRTMLLCALSGINKRVGNHPRIAYSHHPATRWHGQSHIFTRYCEVLKAAGIECNQQLPVLYCATSEQQKVAGWLKQHQLEAGTFVICHAGASPSRADKRWPYFSELAAQLRHHELRVVWVGTASEGELNRGLSKPGDVDATDAFSVNELAELGRHARFAVTNDSGPMHILAAAAIPVFGLFGPSDWRRNHALGQAERVITPGVAGEKRLSELDAAQVIKRIEAEALLA